MLFYSLGSWSNNALEITETDVNPMGVHIILVHHGWDECTLFYSLGSWFNNAQEIIETDV